jgi:hypothetical protein
MAHEFETLNQAASALLVETCALLNERGPCASSDRPRTLVFEINRLESCANEPR